MLQMTFQANVKSFLGKPRAVGDVLREELAEALNRPLSENGTTMTAIKAMKNMNLVILQDSDELSGSKAAGIAEDRLSALEQNVANICEKLGLEVVKADAETLEPAAPERKPRARRTKH